MYGFENDRIKISCIELQHYKNVSYGKIDFSDWKELEEGKGSITGIYGQNGSGKTSIISAVTLIKTLLEGKALPEDIGEHIEAGKDHARIGVTFYLGGGETKTSYLARYTCTIGKTREKTYMKEESLHYRCKEGESGWGRETGLLVNCYDRSEFSPKRRNGEIACLYETKVDMLVAKKIAAQMNRSFLFSDELIGLVGMFRDRISSEFLMIHRLRFFARDCLFIIDNRKIALSDANLILPIAFRRETNKQRLGSGQISIALNKPAELGEDEMRGVKVIFESSNRVLNELIPGLTMDLVEIGRKMSDKGRELVIFELLSCREGMKIPIRYESDGIKKIVAVLHMLISLYNSETITVLIDELDAGIFEYLLGEMLQIIEEKSKGQLIFTSHNLRPLEILRRDNLVFTTVNPKNRYIRLQNGKARSNLRDTYYRDIVLGGQSEEIYVRTNTAKISRAFRKAGEGR